MMISGVVASLYATINALRALLPVSGSARGHVGAHRASIGDPRGQVGDIAVVQRGKQDDDIPRLRILGRCNTSGALRDVFRSLRWLRDTLHQAMICSVQFVDGCQEWCGTRAPRAGKKYDCHILDTDHR